MEKGKKKNYTKLEYQICERLLAQVGVNSFHHQSYLKWLAVSHWGQQIQIINATRSTPMHRMVISGTAGKEIKNPRLYKIVSQPLAWRTYVASVQCASTLSGLELLTTFLKEKEREKKKISFLRGAECFHSAILNLLWIIYIRGKEREGKVRRARLNHKLLGSGCDSGHVGVGCGYYNQWQGDMCPLRHSGHVMARSPITNDNVGFLYPTIQKEQSFVGFITIMLWLLHNWEKLMIK